MCTEKRVLVGFDGSIDRTVKPIRLAGQNNLYFRTIDEFGGYIAGKAGLSCSIQTEVLSSRGGGNAPYVAWALRRLGFSVDVVGMLGSGMIAPEFEPLRALGAGMYSYAEPAQSECFEFDDGKIMLAPQVAHMEQPIVSVCNALGSRTDTVEQADLMALLNWGEIKWMQTLWSQWAERFVYPAGRNLERYLFLDPADISCRTEHEIRELLRLIGEMAHYRYTILSVNENEALRLSSVLMGQQTEVEAVLRYLVENGYVQEAVVHTVYQTTAYNGKQLVSCPTQHVKRPVISTGAGDNFNAGYCAAVLRGFPLEKRVTCANHTSRIYLTTGVPADWSAVDREVV